MARASSASLFRHRTFVSEWCPLPPSGTHKSIFEEKLGKLQESLATKRDVFGSLMLMSQMGPTGCSDSVSYSFS